MNVPEKELRKVGKAAMDQAGLPAAQAEMALNILISADLQGISTHGTSRLPIYLKRMERGLINSNPQLHFSQPSPILRVLDGDDGLGPVVGMTGLKEGIKIAKKMGLAFVGCRRSNHFGPGAPYALAACRENLILIGGTNAFSSMAPTGSMDVFMGNNPLFIGFPRKKKAHFILDVAMSMAARGKMRKAAENKEPIPLGWALDPDGNPTTDPQLGLKGLVLPMAGHKGYGLAMVVDLLAGLLSGAGTSTGVLSLYQQWEKPQNVGHFFILINPAFFMELDTFFSRGDAYFKKIKSARAIESSTPVLYPGEIEAEHWQRQKDQGISMPDKQWHELIALSQGKRIESLAAY